MVAKCSLASVWGKAIGKLSRGYKQRVGMAQALLHDPEVLILDEPTSGLDPNQVAQVRDLIQDLSKNKTILLSTHILREVQAICDRVMILINGEVKADASLEDLAQTLGACAGHLKPGGALLFYMEEAFSLKPHLKHETVAHTYRQGDLEVVVVENSFDPEPADTAPHRLDHAHR